MKITVWKFQVLSDDHGGSGGIEGPNWVVEAGDPQVHLRQLQGGRQEGGHADQAGPEEDDRGRRAEDGQGQGEGGWLLQVGKLRESRKAGTSDESKETGKEGKETGGSKEGKGDKGDEAAICGEAQTSGKEIGRQERKEAGGEKSGEKGEEVKKDPVSPFLTFCNLCVETSNESELWIKFWCKLSSNFHFC